MCMCGLEGGVLGLHLRTCLHASSREGPTCLWCDQAAWGHPISVAPLPVSWMTSVRLAKWRARPSDPTQTPPPSPTFLLPPSPGALSATQPAVSGASFSSEVPVPPAPHSPRGCLEGGPPGQPCPPPSTRESTSRRGCPRLYLPACQTLRPRTLLRCPTCSGRLTLCPGAHVTPVPLLSSASLPDGGALVTSRSPKSWRNGGLALLLPASPPPQGLRCSALPRQREAQDPTLPAPSLPSQTWTFSLPPPCLPGPLPDSPCSFRGWKLTRCSHSSPSPSAKPRLLLISLPSPRPGRPPARLSIAAPWFTHGSCLSSSPGALPAAVSPLPLP